MLIVGTGTIVDQGETAAADLPPDYGEVTAIGFGTPQDPDSGWIINKNMGNYDNFIATAVSYLFG